MKALRLFGFSKVLSIMLPQRSFGFGLLKMQCELADDATTIKKWQDLKPLRVRKSYTHTEVCIEKKMILFRLLQT